MSSKRYLPFLSGKYIVGPGLSILKAEKSLLFDDSFTYYHAEKMKARRENIDKYYQRLEVSDDELLVVIETIAKLCAHEYPQKFKLTQSDNFLQLECFLTREVLIFKGAHFDSHESTLNCDYRDGLDALMAQIQEDMSLWRRLESGDEFLTLIHLSYPNHWSPAEKIGKNFNDVHIPVGEWEHTLAPKAQQLVKTMIEKGPFVRFAWGLATDQRLNHHPCPPAGIETSNWHGRRFNPEAPQLFVRVERQVLHPISQLGLALFFIRTFFYDVKELELSEREALAQSLNSMAPESLAYKGLQRDRDEILSYLLSF